MPVILHSEFQIARAFENFYWRSEAIAGRNSHKSARYSRLTGLMGIELTFENFGQ